MYTIKILLNKVATTLVGVLFIELILNLSHVKQMIFQTIHVTHELILCILITRKREDINRDYTVKIPCWYQVLNLLPSNPDLLCFAVVPYLQELHRSYPIQAAGVPLSSGHQQAVQTTVKTFRNQETTKTGIVFAGYKPVFLLNSTNIYDYGGQKGQEIKPISDSISD